MRASSVLFFLWCAVCSRCSLRTDQQFWLDLVKNELDEALAVRWNVNRAKNVIIFIGDGMGPNTVTATRIYKGGESHQLSFEKFPHTGLLKTYSANRMVPDSASTATAMLCGVKANHQTMGVDATVQVADCAGSLRNETRLKSLAATALEAGKSAGLVTTMRVTHATPAPLYSHSSNRRWECEANMPEGTESCKDIARQLVEDWPGRDLNVILGGGRQVLISNTTGTASDPLDTWSCRSNDGRNLINDYITDKDARGLAYSYVTNNQELADFDTGNTDYLLGIFANGHLHYEHERDHRPQGMPSISNMTEAAIKVLRKNPNGFFLMVEGGNVDMAHHRGRAKTAINEAAAMEDAVRLAMEMTDEEDTLIIVTSDHTHTLQINGYPERGSNIFGIVGESRQDGINYTTLAYTTGGPGSFHFSVKSENGHSEAVRDDASSQDTNSFDYEQVAAIRLDENYHGGGDVAIYARGPMAHLFHNVHEQHYVYHVISYASKIGSYSGASSIAAVNLWQAIILAAILLYVK